MKKVCLFILLMGSSLLGTAQDAILKSEDGKVLWVPIVIVGNTDYVRIINDSNAYLEITLDEYQKTEGEFQVVLTTKLLVGIPIYEPSQNGIPAKVSIRKSTGQLFREKLANLIHGNYTVEFLPKKKICEIFTEKKLIF